MKDIKVGDLVKCNCGCLTGLIRVTKVKDIKFDGVFVQTNRKMKGFGLMQEVEKVYVSELEKLIYNID